MAGASGQEFKLILIALTHARNSLRKLHISVVSRVTLQQPPRRPSTDWTPTNGGNLISYLREFIALEELVIDFGTHNPVDDRNGLLQNGHIRNITLKNGACLTIDPDSITEQWAVEQNLGGDG